MSSACRTCTRTVSNDEGFSLTGSSFGSNILQIKDVLTWCVPELDLNLIPGSLICKNCALALHSSYQFRIETLRNEEALQKKKHVNAFVENDETADDLKVEVIYADLDENVGDVIEIISESQGEEDEEEVTEDDKTTKEMPRLTVQTLKSYIEFNGSGRKLRDIQRPFKCPSCNFCSDSKASLAMHERIHTGETPFPCTVCPYKAKRKAHLEVHMKTHTGERPFSCPSCPRHFTTKQMMKNHMRTHTGETPYRCLQCNFTSRHKLSIANHIKRVHIGLTGIYAGKPNVCYVCGKLLSGTQSFSAHMRIHTGTKSHLCEWCGKYFREKGMLKNHIRTHTGEKPFKCTECDYSTTRKAHVQLHMKLHDGRKELITCSECGKRYVTKFLMTKHVREEHQIVKPSGVDEESYEADFHD